MITQYNWELIGERIKVERVSARLTMEQVAEQVGSSRQTISRWERGEGVEITLNMLLRLCDIFKCELGYLLGEYDCKTRQATDIQNETGLTEKAITALALINSNVTAFLDEKINTLNVMSDIYSQYAYMSVFINDLLENCISGENFIQFRDLASSYVAHKSQYKEFEPEEYLPEAYKQEFNAFLVQKSFYNLIINIAKEKSKNDKESKS